MSRKTKKSSIQILKKKGQKEKVKVTDRERKERCRKGRTALKRMITTKKVA